jgi:hypothetical protein
MPIFVITQFSGYEGHSAPVQAFEREQDARAAIAIVSHSETWRLYAVPIWPEPAEPYFQIKPIT